jgi:hypothetical protein
MEGVLHTILHAGSAILTVAASLLLTPFDEQNIVACVLFRSALLSNLITLMKEGNHSRFTYATKQVIRCINKVEVYVCSQPNSKSSILSSIQKMYSRATKQNVQVAL